MKKVRIIARLDIKNEFVIKGIQLEGLRKIGNPIVLAKKYYEEGADELIFMDSVASLYGRNNLFHIIEEACKEVFIPITIGGGIRTLEDIDSALKSGADKIALNTAAVKDPTFITQAAKRYGSQCIIGSIEAKKKNGSWEAYIDNGREETGLNAINWAKELEDLGAGEIMVTSIDREGTKRGFDLELVKQVNAIVNLPVISSGGSGRISHFKEVVNATDISGLATASLLHYEICSMQQLKQELNNEQIPVRL